MPSDHPDMGSPSLTDWLQASGGVGSAVTAIVLAYKQMRASRQQADAADAQVKLMRAELPRPKPKDSTLRRKISVVRKSRPTGTARCASKSRDSQASLKPPVTLRVASSSRLSSGINGAARSEGRMSNTNSAMGRWRSRTT